MVVLQQVRLNDLPIAHRTSAVAVQEELRQSTPYIHGVQSVSCLAPLKV